jgi:large subunit ribosomal protein L5
MTRLLERYKKEILPQLAEQLGKANPLSVPRVEKVVVNMGVGAALQEQKRLDEAADSLGLITGQRPVITKAKRSVSGFRLREGMKIGCMVTLRGRRMYEFLDRLISLALPRVRDFRGLRRNAFDGHGNYSLGISEQMVFPEIDPDRVSHVQGMDVTIVTTARDNEEGYALLSALGMPFQSG